jgi:hypothetical protein
MQLFLSVEFLIGLLIGLALRASNVERDLLQPWRYVRTRCPHENDAR